MSELLAEMAFLLQAESRLFWLFMSRRIALARSSFGESDRTEVLHEEYTTLAILRFAQPSGTDFTHVTGPVQPGWFEGDEPQPLRGARTASGLLLPRIITRRQVEAAFRLDRLAYAFWACGSQLRRVWKGALLEVSDSGRVNPAQPARLERLIQLYDRRTNSTPLLAHVGLDGGPALRVASRGKPGLYMWALQLNRQQTRVRLGWAAGGDSNAPTYAPRYRLLLANLEEYLAAVEPFRTDISARTGNDPWALAVFVASLSRHFLERWRQEPERTIQYESFGYGISVNRDVLMHEMPSYFDMYSRAIGLAVTDSRSQVDKILHDLSLDE